jgi:glycosyltransferase involved in cell wall biosynthesis
MGPFFELVVPAYNESKNLEALIQRTVASAEQAGFGAEDFRFIVVNNGSGDDSSKVLSALKDGSLGRWFEVVDVPVNKGYGYGIWQGLQSTRSEYVGWSHADLQCDPANAFKALEQLRASGAQKMVVKGSRVGRSKKEIFVSRVFEFMANVILGLGVKELNAQPKVFRRELLLHLSNPPWTFAFDLYVLYTAKRNGYLIREFEVLFPARIHGFSNWSASFFRRYRTILRMIIYMFELRTSKGNPN